MFALFNKAISVRVMYAAVDLESVCEVAFKDCTRHLASPSFIYAFFFLIDLWNRHYRYTGKTKERELRQ